jgi:hypothetical protein
MLTWQYIPKNLKHDLLEAMKKVPTNAKAKDFHTRTQAATSPVLTQLATPVEFRGMRYELWVFPQSHTTLAGQLDIFSKIRGDLILQVHRNKNEVPWYFAPKWVQTLHLLMTQDFGVMSSEKFLKAVGADQLVGKRATFVQHKQLISAYLVDKVYSAGNEEERKAHLDQILLYRDIVKEGISNP